MPSWLGPWEILIVVVIILLVFGGKLIPRLGSSLGRSVVGLKKGLKEGEEGFKDAVKEDTKVDSTAENVVDETTTKTDKTDQTDQSWVYPRMAPGLFKARTVAAPEVSSGQTMVTPLARVAVLRLGSVCLVRSRPTGVVVSREGRIRRVPIRDVTRITQAGILLVALLCACGLSLRAARRREKSA
jgi:sec-independent protein translocase protein TatA